MINKQVSGRLGNAVAQMLKEARKVKGWTVYRLQEKSGIAAANIQHIESGQVCPRIDTLSILCDALDIEIIIPLSV